MSEQQAASMPRRAAAEALGTCFLLAAVVGSGIMAERLFADAPGLALLANSAATAAALVALILAFGPISGAHFNPAVTLPAAFDGELAAADAPVYVLAQLAGAAAGVMLANRMFELPAVFLSQHARSGSGLLLSEAVATFGLLAVILGCARSRSAPLTALAVAGYIAAAYWFTASTSFANPAVTIARTLTDTFAGIAPADAPAFVAAQLAGAAAATAVYRWLLPAPQPARSARIEVAAGQGSGA